MRKIQDEKMKNFAKKTLKESLSIAKNLDEATQLIGQRFEKRVDGADWTIFMHQYAKQKTKKWNLKHFANYYIDMSIGDIGCRVWTNDAV